MPLHLTLALNLLERLAPLAGYNKEAFKRLLLDNGFAKVGRSLYGWKDEHDQLVALFTLVDSKGSDSNTITSLKNVFKHNNTPFIAVFLDPGKTRFKLANSSLIRKASHPSSKGITIAKIKGSFNTGDIMNELSGVTNDRSGLVALFAKHLAQDPEENRVRIVEATQGIKGRAPGAPPDWAAVERNLQAGIALLDEATLKTVREKLFARVETVKQAILDCTARTSTKAFGDCVERIILDAEPAHALGDITFTNGRVVVDIKARQAGKGSSPKAFNVQKLVDHLSAGPGSALYFMVTVDVAQRSVSCTLIQMLHPDLFAHYWHYFGWSGRGALGTIALKGDLSRVLIADERLELGPREAVLQLRALLPKDPQAS